MEVAGWVGQGVLMAIFLFSGGFKVTQSKERILATGQTGVRDLPLAAIRFVAVCELVAVAGLFLGMIGVAPILTPLAALGLAFVMVAAAFVHTRLKEPASVVANMVIFAICLFVASGRWA